MSALETRRSRSSNGGRNHPVREQGYQATTVSEIAERRRTDPTNVLPLFHRQARGAVSGSQELGRLWLEAVAAAPAEATPLAVVTAGLDPVAEMFIERHDFARTRASGHRGQPELKERELIKLQTLAGAIGEALIERGVSASAATSRPRRA